MKPPWPVMPSPIGSSAKIVATAVMRIGRRRRRPPSMTASATDAPRWRYWLMRSSSTIALVTTIPTSISMPMSAGTPSAVSDERLHEALERGRHDQEDDGDGGQQGQEQVAERVGLVGA